jgi:hypothetical protein
MKRKKIKKQEGMHYADMEKGECIVTLGYEYSEEDLVNQSKENEKESLVFGQDGCLYIGDRKLSDDEAEKAFLRGSDLPRFNILILIKADKKEMNKIYLIWKSLTTPYSYIRFDLRKSLVSIAFYSKDNRETSIELSYYCEYLVKGKMATIAPLETKDKDSILKLDLLQKCFDIQVIYKHEESVLFTYSLRMIEEAGWVIPYSIQLENDSLKYFKFDMAS